MKIGFFGLLVPFIGIDAFLGYSRADLSKAIAQLPVKLGELLDAMAEPFGEYSETVRVALEGAMWINVIGWPMLGVLLLWRRPRRGDRRR